ncbi:MAG: hypothetical protein ACRELD_13680 [Longimicrobiales bacterium]
MPGLIPGALEPFLPSAGTVALLAPLSALYGAAAAAFAGWLRTRRSMRAPYTRKVFHFLIFTMAGVVQLVWGVAGTIVFGSVIALLVFYACWKGDGFPFYEALARPTDAPHRTLFILVPLLTTALGGVASNLVFAPFAHVGYLVSGWGDAIGEPVGARWGRHRYRVPSLAGVPATRSLEGSAAVFMLSTVAAFLGVWATGLPPATSLGVALACAAAATAAEAISTHGVDNFTVQLVAAGVVWWML